MSTKSWLLVLAVVCGIADWAFKLAGYPELVSTKWFLASCIFVAAWAVAHHLDKRAD